MDRGCDNGVTATETDATAAAQRRRGAALEDAIEAAAYAELSEVGYAGFSIEAVAARARTGKASIYRRWPTKQDLVLQSLCTQLPTAEQCGVVPDFDESTTTEAALFQIARSIAHIMAGPAGDAMRAIKCEAAVDPELARLVDERFQAPRREALIGLLRRGIARGEVRPGADTRVVADTLPALLTYRIILQREPITEADIRTLMAEVFIPLIEVR